jgi:hypothetical protein
VLWVTNCPDTSQQAREMLQFRKNGCNFTKARAGEVLYAVTTGLGVCGGVENINANSDPVETPIQLKRHYEQSEAIQGECYANPSS